MSKNVPLKRLRKKLFSGLGLLILLICLSNAACNPSSVKEPLPSNLNPSAIDNGGILFWHSLRGRISEIVQDSLADYHRVYPHVQIISEYIPQDKLLERFISQSQRGFGPDLLLNTYGIIPDLLQENLIQEIKPTELNLSNYQPVVLEQVRYQGRIYGVPIGILTQALCYNKDKVKTPPTTLDELLQQAKTGYSFGLVSSFSSTFWGAQIFGGQLFDSQGRIILDNGGWAQWMDWLKNNQNEPNIVFVSEQESLSQAFLTDNLSYIVCDSQFIPEYNTKLGKNKLGVAILPGQAGQPAGPLLYTGVLVLNRNSNEQQRELALQVAQFVTNNYQIQKRLIALEGAMISSKKTVKINTRFFPIEGVLTKQIKTGIAVSLDNTRSAQLLFQLAEPFYQKVLAGEMDSQEAATELTQLVNEKIQK